MEGWVRVRFVGTAHWQRLWLGELSKRKNGSNNY